MDRIERIKMMEEKMDKVALALSDIHEAEARLFELLPEIGSLDEYSRTLYNVLEEARYRTEGSEWAD